MLFKTKSGFRGDYYSVLLLGEQTPIEERGLALRPGEKPTLNWHVTEAERRALRPELPALPPRVFRRHPREAGDSRGEWEFRTAAHHSGASNRFLSDPGELTREFFSAKGLRDTFVCDGSLLRAAGIANSGLTLVALVHRLAELIAPRRSRCSQRASG